MMRYSATLLFVLVLLLPFAVNGQMGEGLGSGCTSDIGDRSEIKDCCRGRACVQTVRFRSKLVGATLPYRVVLPAWYNPADGQQPARFPVLYLLHGFSGHYDNWVAQTKLAEYASAYRFIIVTPEGNNSWYTDSATVPTDKYESYIVQELVADVQSRYRTVESREGRAIAGLSMGGYGALKFGVKHPEMFAFAASLSGALGAAVWTENDLRNFGTALPRSIMETFGAAGSRTRADNDLMRLVREFPAARLNQLPYFYLDCGTEDGLLPFSRALADLLLERKIPHEFRQLPGNHNWAYWDAQVREVLRVAAQKIPLARFTAVALSQQSPRSALQRQINRQAMTALRTSRELVAER